MSDPEENMEVANGDVTSTVEDTGKSSNQENGLTNGFDKEHKSHKSSHKHKHKDRHKDGHKSSSSGKDREHGSSSSGHKHKSSSHHHSSSSSSSKHKSSSSDKDKDKDKDGVSSHKHSSSSHKHSSSSSKHKSSSDKDKHRSSSSHHKSSHKSHSKDKDKEGESGHRSSSSGHKSSHKSHKSSHKHKSDKDRKHRDKKEAEEKVQVKEEPLDESQEEKYSPPEEEPVVKEESGEEETEEVKQEEDEEEDQPSQEDEEEQESQVEEASQEDEEEDDDYEEENTSQNKLVIKEEDEEDDEYEEPVQVKQEDSEEEEAEPTTEEEDSDYDEKPKKKSKHTPKKRKKQDSDDDEEDDFAPAKKRRSTSKKAAKVKKEPSTPKRAPARPTPVKKEAASPTKGRKKKVEEEEEVWKWWEDDGNQNKDSKIKWTTLEHNGVYFPDEYEPLPDRVKFYYDGEVMKLEEPAEEVAGFYAKMLNHDYTSMHVFNKNFFLDWRKFMSSKEKKTITDLSKCDFTHIHAYYNQVSEERKARSKEEKKVEKDFNASLVEKYGWCKMDGHKQKLGNFKIEPPGLFRGRGEHPKMGLVKTRTMPEQVLINCSRGAEPLAPEGHKWKEIRHDNTVTWLASWQENVQGATKYVMLNPASKLKGEKDWKKYEMARELAKHVDGIRDRYKEEWKSKEMRARQRAVALYFIDKLALRAGNEKDTDEVADTVGCCSLRVEHITLSDELDGMKYVCEFDFLGKDSMRYYNKVPIEKRVYKNLVLFKENKKDGDDLFDRLNTSTLNDYLRELMEGLTAKVFRTFNASSTLQEELDKLTDPTDNVASKMLSYNRANRAVALLCNHKRTVPKTHDKSMENLRVKIQEREDAVEKAEHELKDLKRGAGRSAGGRLAVEKKQKQVDRAKEMLDKLKVQETDREENKEIALGTSKLNYLDPRISVAWCKKHDVPIEKVYSKTQRDKFKWAIDMATEDFVF